MCDKKEISRNEIATISRLDKSILPIQNKIDRIKEKQNKYIEKSTEQIKDLESQIELLVKVKNEILGKYNMTELPSNDEDNTDQVSPFIDMDEDTDNTGSLPTYISGIDSID